MNENTKPKPIFAEGIRFFRPRENAPEFVKGQIVIERQTLIDFIKRNGNDDIVRLDLLKSKDKGTLYLTLSTWKPTQKKEDDVPNLDF
jgi:hypothetical protein